MQAGAQQGNKVFIRHSREMKGQNFLWNPFIQYIHFKELIQPVSGNSCKSLRPFSLFHTKAQGQHSQKASLLYHAFFECSSVYVCVHARVCMCQRARVLCLCNCISVMSWLFVRWAKALCRQQMINTRVKRKKERPIWIRDSSFFTALLWSSGEAWWSDQGCCKQWDKEWDGRGEWWDFPLWEYMDVLRFLHLYTLTLSFSSWYYCMCTAMYACVCVCVCVLTHTHISNGKSCLSPHPPYQILDWIRSACFGLKRISPHAFCMRL